MSGSEQIESLVTQYVIHQSHIKDLSEQMKVERRVKKQIEKDIIITLIDMEQDEINVNGHKFSITRGLTYKTK